MYVGGVLERCEMIKEFVFTSSEAILTVEGYVTKPSILGN